MIDILMAVYNGEKYLSEQIESILSQNEGDWRLIICDDRSSDSSFAIAEEYARKYPEKILCYRNEEPSGSAQANFMGMLRSSEADYIMFSDHDDVWLPNKISLTLNKMKELEKKYSDAPLLVHGELEITDSSLNVLSRSFTKYQGLDPKLRSLGRLLVQNNVTGCTVMINRRLAELVRNVPAEKMLMHDWWIALAAAAFGEIGFVDEPVIKYRQHGGNQLGAVNNRSLRGALKIVFQRVNTKKRVSMTYVQAENFYEYYRDSLPTKPRECLELYLSIPKRKKLVRACMLIKNKFLKQNFMTAVGQIFFC